MRRSSALADACRPLRIGPGAGTSLADSDMLGRVGTLQGEPGVGPISDGAALGGPSLPARLWGLLRCYPSRLLPSADPSRRHSPGGGTDGSDRSGGSVQAVTRIARHWYKYTGGGPVQRQPDSDTLAAASRPERPTYMPGMLEPLPDGPGSSESECVSESRACLPSQLVPARAGHTNT